MNNDIFGEVCKHCGGTGHELSSRAVNRHVLLRYRGALPLSEEIGVSRAHAYALLNGTRLWTVDLARRALPDLFAGQGE